MICLGAELYTGTNKSCCHESETIGKKAYGRLQDCAEERTGVHHQQEKPQVQATSGVIFNRETTIQIWLVLQVLICPEISGA